MAGNEFLNIDHRVGAGHCGGGGGGGFHVDFLGGAGLTGGATFTEGFDGHTGSGGGIYTLTGKNQVMIGFHRKGSTKSKIAVVINFF